MKSIIFFIFFVYLVLLSLSLLYLFFFLRIYIQPVHLLIIPIHFLSFLVPSIHDLLIQSHPLYKPFSLYRIKIKTTLSIEHFKHTGIYFLAGSVFL